MTPEDESNLLDAWRAGSHEAGNQLMRAYYGRVLGFFAMRAPTAADDLTQRTFLACVEGRERVRESSVGAFVFGIARKMLLKYLDAKRRDQSFAIESARPQSILSPSGVVAQRSEHLLLLRALERLPDEAQILVGMHYVAGLRSREIGDALGLPTSTVTTRLSRAREALRAEVQSLRAPPQARASVLADFETWAASLGPLITDREPPFGGG